MGLPGIPTGSWQIIQYPDGSPGFLGLLGIPHNSQVS